MMAVENDAATLQAHMTRTYHNLRVGIGVIGFALPIVLWVGARLLLPSMSDYYYNAAMRDTFVGAVITIGVFLYLYKGFSTKENWALNAAGAFAVAVALVPTRAPDMPASVRSASHNTFAVAFFLCIAYVSIFRGSDTLLLIRDTRRAEKLRTVYKALGIGMVVAPLVAVAIGTDSRTFLVEAAGVWIFSAYWLVKSREISETDAERLALEGKLQAAPAPPSEAAQVAPGRLMQVEPWSSAAVQ